MKIFRLQQKSRAPPDSADQIPCAPPPLATSAGQRDKKIEGLQRTEEADTPPSARHQGRHTDTHLHLASTAGQEKQISRAPQEAAPLPTPPQPARKGTAP